MFGRNNESDAANSKNSGDQTFSTPKDSSVSNGMFEQSHDVNAFVGEGVEFKGIINYQGTIRIDGHLDGEIHTNGVLLVGKGAVITARVEAGTVISQGRIIGDIVAREKVQLLSSAVLDGSVHTPSISMQEGVLFNGSCKMTAPSRSEEMEIEVPVSSLDDSSKVV